jgi:GNAT superfamily N-acetyltransferase
MLIAYQSEFESTSCFLTFEQELANLPGPYSPPRGAFWLAQADGSPVGCVAVRPLTQSECEMKRLYVCPGSRGSGVGRQLVEHCLIWARFLGYTLMRLDTVLGFVETEPYYSAPVVGVRCLARSL